VYGRRSPPLLISWGVPLEDPDLSPCFPSAGRRHVSLRQSIDPPPFFSLFFVCVCFSFCCFHAQTTLLPSRFSLRSRYLTGRRFLLSFTFRASGFSRSQTGSRGFLFFTAWTPGQASTLAVLVTSYTDSKSYGLVPNCPLVTVSELLYASLASRSLKFPPTVLSPIVIPVTVHTHLDFGFAGRGSTSCSPVQ